MYIKHKPVAAFYKLIIGALSLVMEWYLLGKYGLDALRLFPTWVLFINAIYFLSSALILALSHSKESGKNPCPMVEGMLILGFWLLVMGSALEQAGYIRTVIPLESWVVIIIKILLPLLVMLDWVLFVKKGRWRAMFPFYWLSLPILYTATIIFTAELMLDSAYLRYPINLLNYRDHNLSVLVLWFLIFVVVELAVGYVLYLLDFAMSGKLAKKIVLPHLQTVIVDENGEEICREPEIKTESKDNTEPETKIEPEIKTEPKTEFKSETAPDTPHSHKPKNNSTHPPKSKQKSKSKSKSKPQAKSSQPFHNSQKSKKQS